MGLPFTEDTVSETPPFYEPKKPFGFEPACIFLGVIAGAAIILIVIYKCVQKGLCFCEVSADDKPDVEYAEVATEDSNTDFSGYTLPAKAVPRNLGPAISTPELYSADEKKGASSDEDETSQPATVVSAYGDKLTVDASSPVTKRKAQRQKSKSLETILPGKISLSLQYSKKDLFLLITIHKLEELPPKSQSGVDQVRTSIVLLPAKKYRSKTRYLPVEDANFDVSIKFANVSRNDLFSSALRVRVYGRSVKLGVQLGKEKCLGETTIHLADVAQKDRGLTTSRPLAPKS